MKKFLWIISAVMAVVVAGLVFIYFSPDYDIYIVRSESMKPTVNMGDMIFSGPISGILGQEIEPGAIVTYQKGASLVTHRVVSSFDGTLITKGDAVENPDLQPVSISQVKGICLFKIPKLGYLAAFIHTKLGWFLLIILPAMMLEALIIKEIIKEALLVSRIEPKMD
jgi:signal peptidase I